MSRCITFPSGPTILLVLAACGGSGPTESPPPPPTATTGTLQIQVSGLPGGLGAALHVSGPGGYSRTLTASTTLSDLSSGAYVVAADPVSGPQFGFAPASSSVNATVTAGQTATAMVAYQATSGALQLTLSGLPSDVGGQVAVTGPGGFAQQATASTVLKNLVPGDYMVTPAAAANVGLAYQAAAASVTVTAGNLAVRAVAWALPVLARSTTDRADGDPSAKVKLVYAVTSDATDRQMDTDGTIHRSVSSWQRWLSAQTGGRALRLDTSQGALDIAFVRLARTDAAYAGYGTTMRDSLEKDMAALGFNQADKLYLVFFDGINTTSCGSAPHVPDLPGQVAGVYLRGLPPGAAGCATNPIAASPTAAPGYLEFVSLHEVLHMLGIVSVWAPSFIPGNHVGDDPSDLMYAGASPWTPSRLDQGRQNYYNPAGLPNGIANLATSPYLMP